MLRTIFKNCAGIDVHKKLLVVTIARTDDNNVTEYQTKSFGTFTSDLIECREWLVSNETFDVCMESTGKYWIPVFNVLEEKCKCIICHPKYLRSIPGKKTDKKDSKWISDMFKFGLVEPSFMPPPDIRKLRDLMRYRFKLVCMRTGEKNRFQNSLTVSNIQLASVFSDVFGKTSQDILKVILKNPNATLDDIKPYFRKNIKSTPEDILKSINGSFDDTQSSKISVCLCHYNNINECIASIEEQVLKLIINYRDEMNLLLTIPGISSTSAMFIIAEIGVNMNAFVDDKHLCSWAGLTPRCKESAGKKQSVRIIKAGQYIKPLLVECALNAIKDKSCPYIKDRYESLKKRRGHKKAIIAIARLLLTACYFVLLNKTEFDYKRYDDLLNKKNKKHARKIKSDDEMIEHLKSLGYTITPAE